MKNVVVIGGGTGLSTLLRGLRDYPIDLTAIVTMTDDGASSGRLRKTQGILPPGDIRKCIAALSHNETGLIDLFEYRYRKGLGLKGHNVGNLIIAALMEMTGSFELAVERISDMLKIRGRVLPATLDDVHLAAIFQDGNRIVGEAKIRKYAYKKRIKKLSLSEVTKTNPRALTAIASADIIFIGPGSLYTSVIPNFLQKKLADSVRNAAVPKVYLANVSTERGETEGFTLEDHLRTLKKYQICPDFVLANNGKAKARGKDQYVTEVTVEGCNICDEKVILADVINDGNPLYHDSRKLGTECYKLILKSAKLKKRNLL